MTYDHVLTRFNDLPTTQIRRRNTLPQVRELFLRGKTCTDCDLSKTRKNIVWSRGSGVSRIMLVGEAPGEAEDLAGSPFVGRSGQLLEQALIECGFDSKTLYICNTLKCRPPANRIPWTHELRACGKYLHAQIVEQQPKLLVAVGKTAQNTLINNYKIRSVTEPVSAVTLVKLKIDGKLQDLDFGLENVWLPMYSIWHPAYILRQFNRFPEYVEQIRLIKTLLDSPLCSQN